MGHTPHHHIDLAVNGSTVGMLRQQVISATGGPRRLSDALGVKAGLLREWAEGKDVGQGVERARLKLLSDILVGLHRDTSHEYPTHSVLETRTTLGGRSVLTLISRSADPSSLKGRIGAALGIEL